MCGLFENDVRGCRPVALEEVLAARDRRRDRQRDLIQRHALPLVSFTLNIPGEYKAYPLAEQAFRVGTQAMRNQLRRAGKTVVHEEETKSPAGFEWVASVDGGQEEVKRLAMAVEDSHSLGRLFDIDIIGTDGAGVRGNDAGREERQCIICGKPVWECARSRAHPAEELSRRTASLIREYFENDFADTIAAMATKALLYEVNTTPKPGLVDRNNAGSHRDMDLFTFVDSSVVLTPYFRHMALQGRRFESDPATMLPRLRFSGMEAEERMLAATSGVNTHKGLVFSMGILCAGAGYQYARGGAEALVPERLLAVCGVIASETPRELRRDGCATHGERAFAAHGMQGVRGEAAAGYPSVREYGYPALRDALSRGCSANDAGVMALLHLVAHVDDTNIVARAGEAALRAVQKDARDFLRSASGSEPEAAIPYATALDERCIEQRISPGGSADLLAIAWFLHFVNDYFLSAREK
jgi:holo-ACP synthase CitX